MRVSPSFLLLVAALSLPAVGAAPRMSRKQWCAVPAAQRAKIVADMRREGGADVESMPGFQEMLHPCPSDSGRSVSNGPGPGRRGASRNTRPPSGDAGLIEGEAGSPEAVGPGGASDRRHRGTEAGGIAPGGVQVRTGFGQGAPEGLPETPDGGQDAFSIGVSSGASDWLVCGKYKPAEPGKTCRENSGYCINADGYMPLAHEWWERKAKCWVRKYQKETGVHPTPVPKLPYPQIDILSYECDGKPEKTVWTYDWTTTYTTWSFLIFSNIITHHYRLRSDVMGYKADSRGNFVFVYGPEGERSYKQLFDEDCGAVNEAVNMGRGRTVY